MKKVIRFLASVTGRKPEKTQEQLKREYEEKLYDHYLAFGSAFVNFCGRK